MLCHEGLRFYIKTGNKEETKLERRVPDSCATFQTNRKLYICGGFHAGLRTDLLSIDYSGKHVKLHSMKHEWQHLSLTGLSSELIALGGYWCGILKVCEKYDVRANKWSGLPSLRTARQLPGSILLSSMRAFCFCGAQGSGTRLNSIESLQTNKDSKWKTLPLNRKIGKAFDLGAVKYGNKIVLFGGSSSPLCT